MTGTVAVAGGRLRLAEGLALAAALAWSALIVVAAALVPVYQSETATTSKAESGTVAHTVTQGSSTLVDENGSGTLVIVAIPLLVSVLVACALWVRGSRRGAGLVAWALTGLLVCFNLLAMLSIGVFIVPVTACLFVACALHQGRALGDARQRIAADPAV